MWGRTYGSVCAVTPAQAGRVAWTVQTMFVVGALSVVLKGSKLAGSAIYAGIPARRIERRLTAARATDDAEDAEAAIGFSN